MNSHLNKIMRSALIVGTLDIAAAFLHYYIKTGKGPSGVLKYIASAIFGKEAFAGSNLMLAWGLFLHYCVAFIFTAIFFYLYKFLLNLFKNKFALAISYGIFMWATMQFVVVPLSNAPTSTLKTEGAIIAILILIICIAIPLTWIADKYYRKSIG